MLVEVDLTDAPRRLFHAHLVMPVKPGTVALVYPKWIPGEHMPSGPVVDVAGNGVSGGRRRASLEA